MSEATTYGDLTQKWQDRFRLLDSIGVSEDSYMGDQDRMNALDGKDRNKLIFNWPAFLFNVFYYWFKGMGVKGTLLWALSMVVATVVAATGFAGAVPIGAWLLPGVVAAVCANTDYYRKVKFGERGWPFLPAFLGRPLGAIIVLLVALAANLAFALVMEL